MEGKQGVEAIAGKGRKERGGGDRHRDGMRVAEVGGKGEREWVKVADLRLSVHRVVGIS